MVPLLAVMVVSPPVVAAVARPLPSMAATVGDDDQRTRVVMTLSRPLTVPKAANCWLGGGLPAVSTSVAVAGCTRRLVSPTMGGGVLPPLPPAPPGPRFSWKVQAV